MRVRWYTDGEGRGHLGIASVTAWVLLPHQKEKKRKGKRGKEREKEINILNTEIDVFGCLLFAGSLG